MKPRHAHLNRDATPLGINLHFPQSAKWMSSVGNRTVSEIACMPRCPALPRPAGPGAKSEPPLVSQPGLFWYSIPNSARYLPHFLGHLIQLVTESSFCRAWRTTCQNLPMNKEKKNTNRVIVSLLCLFWQSFCGVYIICPKSLRLCRHAFLFRCCVKKVR